MFRWQNLLFQWMHVFGFHLIGDVKTVSSHRSGEEGRGA